jgi:hypothetical protein
MVFGQPCLVIHFVVWYLHVVSLMVMCMNFNDRPIRGAVRQHWVKVFVGFPIVDSFLR